MTNTSSNPTPIPISDYFESSYSLEGNFSFENLDYYADGTLFPVHIGDLFPPKDEGDESHLYRYKVLLKIGHGSYSTVWLAIDLENETHVALKFLSRGRDTELSLYQSLSEAEGSLGQESVVTLRNSFRVGLRNEHTVLVFDVLIPWTFLTQKQKEQLNLKATVFELASGLSFLHSTNITHGDLHQGNLALKISPEFMFTGDEFIGELNFPDVIPILPIPYSKERVRQPPPNYQPPKYLMSNNVFLDYAKEVLSHEGALSTAKLQIIDLSNAYQNTPTEIPLTKRTVRAPESFMEELTSLKFHSGRPADIWALAVTIFEILSGPKDVLYFASRNSATALKSIMTQIATPVPEPWTRALLEKGIVAVKVEGDATDQPPWEKSGLTLVDESVRGKYLDLLRKMLIINPVDRPTCEEVCLCLSKIMKESEAK
ncbi:hypothetical protein OCU04_004546 [Sclerotinia nivalis]|uniref:Protein kinase domain-containing protein n=1 Tax=Sclerotinia nivalis TaxID=352851 RepID=A0A9X0AQN9_9HELO|nr:hypothetical protein OCU04_004546 [Sclerotinia nivalis]